MTHHFLEDAVLVVMNKEESERHIESLIAKELQARFGEQEHWTTIMVWVKLEPLNGNDYQTKVQVRVRQVDFTEFAAVNTVSPFPIASREQAADYVGEVAPILQQAVDRMRAAIEERWAARKREEAAAEPREN